MIPVWTAGINESGGTHHSRAACDPVHSSPPRPQAIAGCRWLGCEGGAVAVIKWHNTTHYSYIHCIDHRT